MLTLYERLPADELPFYLNLMAHLARSGVEVPGARARPHRRAVLDAERQARGARRRASTASPVEPPTPSHCAAVGGALGRLHVASQTLPRAPHQSPRARLVAPGGARRAAVPHAGAERAARTTRSSSRPDSAKVKLPKGAIHGDLFCDNVLFDGDAVAGIIDFGFAATDFLAYDLAITVNDWCDRAATASLDLDAHERVRRPATTRCAR